MPTNKYVTHLIIGLFIFSTTIFGDQELGNNFSFVKVEPGEFIMGSPPNEESRKEDEIPVKVKIKEFEIGKTEVTQGIWKKVMGSLPEKLSENPSDESAITYVSWNDVQKFIEKLNKKRSRGGYTYRLPTAAEWEYAARGGHKVSEAQRQWPYFFGKTAAQIDDYARYEKNTQLQAQPVASRKANPLGLFDIYGNVWEWTTDKDGKDRVLKGGSWSDCPSSLRSARRFSWPPSDRLDSIGFRLVRQKLN